MLVDAFLTLMELSRLERRFALVRVATLCMAMRRAARPLEPLTAPSRIPEPDFPA